jgi:hypothetical protein
MGDGKHASRDSGDKAKTQSSSDEGGLFSRVMGGLRTVKDAAVEKGGQAIHGGAELIKENAPKVQHAVKENAPKVKQAASDLAHSPVGKAAVGIGTEVYNEEKATGNRVVGAAKRGDILAVGKEVAPLVIMGPQGVILDKVGRKALDKGVQELPKEHQGTARGALELGKIANGGIPDAKHVITGAVLDADTRSKAMETAKGAGSKVLGWFGVGDHDKKAEVKAAGKADKSGYPDDERQQDLPKRPATKK